MTSLKPYFARIYSGAFREYCQKLDEALGTEKKLFVITANPEILMHAQREEEIHRMLLDEQASITPDGISVVKAMQMLGLEAKERITGVDMAEHLLEEAGKRGSTVCLLGAKEEVISALTRKLKEKYPEMKLYAHNGYDGDKDEILRGFAEKNPDLVIVGLGVPAQEKLLYRHLSEFSRGIFMGVGGSFDVFSGLKKRAPAFFVKTNTEWLYRIAKEPSRLKRFWESNVKFLGLVRKEARKNS